MAAVLTLLSAYRTPAGEINIFRVRKHAARMAASTSFISVPPVPIDLFASCVHLAVSLNAEFVPPHDTDTSLYIRPLVFGSSSQLGLTPPKEYIFCVYVLPINSYHGNHPVDALILDNFDRAAPKGVGSAKVGGNYAPVMKWSGAAKEAGYGITLHLDSKTGNEIEEFSTSGFIGIRQIGDDFTMVVPDSKNVIPSITSDSCVQIAKSWGWTVEIRPVSLLITISLLFLIRKIRSHSQSCKTSPKLSLLELRRRWSRYGRLRESQRMINSFTGMVIMRLGRCV